MEGTHMHRIDNSVSAADASHALPLIVAHQLLHVALSFVLDPSINVGIIALGVVYQVALDLANLLAKSLILHIKVVVARLQAQLYLLELVHLCLLLLPAL